MGRQASPPGQLALPVPVSSVHCVEHRLRLVPPSIHRPLAQSSPVLQLVPNVPGVGAL
jgi:hypothetical protein